MDHVGVRVTGTSARTASDTSEIHSSAYPPMAVAPTSVPRRGSARSLSHPSADPSVVDRTVSLTAALATIGSMPAARAEASVWPTAASTGVVYTARGTPR